MRELTGNTITNKSFSTKTIDKELLQKNCSILMFDKRTIYDRREADRRAAERRETDRRENIYDRRIKGWPEITDDDLVKKDIVIFTTDRAGKILKIHTAKDQSHDHLVGKTPDTYIAESNKIDRFLKILTDVRESGKHRRFIAKSRFRRSFISELRGYIISALANTIWIMSSLIISLEQAIGSKDQASIEVKTIEQIKIYNSSDLIIRVGPKGTVHEIIKNNTPEPQELYDFIPRYFMEPSRLDAYISTLSKTLKTGTTSHFSALCLTKTKEIIHRKFIITKSNAAELIIYSKITKNHHLLLFN